MLAKLQQLWRSFIMVSLKHLPRTDSTRFFDKTTRNGTPSINVNPKSFDSYKLVTKPNLIFKGLNPPEPRGPELSTKRNEPTKTVVASTPICDVATITDVFDSQVSAKNKQIPLPCSAGFYEVGWYVCILKNCCEFQRNETPRTSQPSLFDSILNAFNYLTNNSFYQRIDSGYSVRKPPTPALTGPMGRVSRYSREFEN